MDVQFQAVLTFLEKNTWEQSTTCDISELGRWISGQSICCTSLGPQVQILSAHVNARQVWWYSRSPHISRQRQGISPANQQPRVANWQTPSSVGEPASACKAESNQQQPSISAPASVHPCASTHNIPTHTRTRTHTWNIKKVVQVRENKTENRNQG